VNRLSLIFVFTLATCVCAVAQEPEGPAPDEETPEQAQESSAVVENPGDVVILRNGSRMTGVQVLRETPQFYEIEVTKGLTPMQIPRRQVKEVLWDDYDPGREELLRQLFPEQQEVTIASGERVTSGLRNKLMEPATAEPLEIRNQDFVEVLNELKTKRGINLRIHKSIEELPPRRRNWTVSISPDKTLLALLREDLVSAFSFVEVVFEGDKIIVMTKEAAKARAERLQSSNPPENDTAPPPGE
jgi:hypothetical protein